MKHTKTAVALALAGVAAAPLAQAADGVSVTLSGQVAIGIIGSDAADEVAINLGDPIPDATSATGFRDATDEDVRDSDSPGDLALFGDDATLNLKAVAPIKGGLESFAVYRTDLSLVGDAATGDNIHVGIKGGFGEFRIGEVPDAVGYGQHSDFIADIDGENTGLSYTSPDISGFVFGANWSPAGSSDRTSFGAKFSIAGFGIGVGVSDDAGTSEFAAKATYSIAGVSLGVSFKDFDNDNTAVIATAGYGISDWSFGLGWEGRTGDVNEGESQLRFDIGYNLGNGMNLSTRVNLNTPVDGATDVLGNELDDITNFRLLLTKAF